MYQPPESPRSNTPSPPAGSALNALHARPIGSSLDALNARIIACERCPRLRAWCTEVARTRRRAYRDETYWGRPVPSFGDPAARILILGLAPGAHGSNRTGRPFTGDGSGNFLYPVLHEVGFASQAAARNREDGMRLRDLWITSVGRCAPPDNKPTPAELTNCAAWLDEEIALLTRLRVVVCLGHIAWNGYLQHLRRRGHAMRAADYPFRHSAEYEMPDGVTLVGSYHPSLQNTNTGRLTREMFLDIFARARLLASRKSTTRPRRKAEAATV
jgi:uracil-DNA glycosylase family 4